MVEAGFVNTSEQNRNNGSATSLSSSCPSIRTRSLIKIQDGCDDFCSFCIVPYTRGREHSLPSDKVLEEVRARVAAGYREVTLTGTKIGAYQRDGAGNRLCVAPNRQTSGLPSLIERILKETEVERLRLSSLQPHDLTPQTVKLWAEKRLCPHLHLPLQSGSDRVLQRMKRQYSTEDYQRAVSLAREAIPDLAITTDILVGFPGESESEFEKSYRFCQRIGFANLHVFPYSPRPGTAAARMPQQVEDRVKKERTQRMLALAKESAHRFREQFLGRTVPVLWERKAERGVWSGLTDNYLRVFVESETPLTNRLLPVRLVGECKQGLFGETVDGRENG
jgi:threonylcarbamoyladenosine tRNA methylthiotransferase MtaB